MSQQANGGGGSEAGNGTEHRIPCQIEEGERMSTMRRYLEQTVDNIVAKLGSNHFVNAMPAGLNQEFVFALKSRFCSVMKTKICAEIERSLRDDDIPAKLNNLDNLVKNTQHSIS